MSDINVLVPSGTTNNKLVQVTKTATAGDVLHTAVTGTTDFDSITVYATNTSGSDVVLTIEFGGTGTANNWVNTVPAESSILACPAMRLQNGLVVAAFAATGSVINCYVEVDRVTV